MVADSLLNKELTVSDTHDHDSTRFVRVPGDTPETLDGREARQAQTLPPVSEREPSLDSVDFDVTAGFGDEPAPPADEFFDITEGSPAESAPEILDLSPEEPVDVMASAPASPPPAAAPSVATSAPVTAPSTGGGKLAIVAVIIAALIAAGLWFVMR